MTVIATNTAALRSANSANKANQMLSTAAERLSTGKRINSAKDDSAGLAIASSMSAQIRGMSQGIRNANDGISMAQTAEGALDEVSNMLQRMRELQVKSLNGTYSDADKLTISAEQKQLAEQIKSTITNNTFNGKPLFNTDNNNVSIQTGASATDTVTLKLGNLTTTPGVGTPERTAGGSARLYTAASADTSLVGSKYTPDAAAVTAGAEQADGTAMVAGTEYTVGVGDKVYVQPTTVLEAAVPGAGGSALADVVDFAANAASALKAGVDLGKFDEALKSIASTRADLGSAQNRLQSAVNSATNTVANLSDARSRIEDADFSAESTNLAKAQILSQASTAMLAQANQSQQSVLSLLR